MHALFPANSNVESLSALADEVYDLYALGANQHEWLQSHVMELLLLANSDAVQDIDDTFPGGKDLWTPRMAMAPFRIPSQLHRDALATIGVRNLPALLRLSVAQLKTTADPGLQSDAGANGALQTCELMHLEGMTYNLASVLVASQITSISALAKATQSDLFALLDPFMTQSQVTLELWVSLSVQARLVAVISTEQATIPTLTWGPDVEQLLEQEEHWRELEQAADLTENQRSSASEILAVLGLLRHYTKGAVAAFSHDWPGVFKAFRSLASSIETWTGQGESTTLLDVVERVRLALRDIELGHLQSYADSLGHDDLICLRSFTLGQLESSVFDQTVPDAIEHTPILDLPMMSKGKALNSFAELSTSDIAAFTGSPLLGVGERTAQSRLLDLGEADQFQTFQNLSTATMGSLPTATAKGVLLDAAISDVASATASFGSLDLSSLTQATRDNLPFNHNLTTVADRYIDLRVLFFSKIQQALSVDNTFSDEFVKRALAPYVSERRSLRLEPAAFGDLSSFLVALPLLLAGPVQTTTARALLELGDAEGAMALLRGASQGATPAVLAGNAAVLVDAFDTDSVTESQGVVSQLDDLSGNARHMVGTSGGPPMSTATYPSASGAVLLPEPTKQKRLRFNNNPAIIAPLTDVSIVDWSPHNLATDSQNQFGLNALRTGSGQQSCLGFKQRNALRHLQISAGGTWVTPSNPIVIPLPGTSDHWLVKGMRRTVSAPDSEWRLVMIHGDASGLLEIRDETWSESSTANPSGSAQQAMDTWSGCQWSSGSDGSNRAMGGGSLWPESLSDEDFERSLIAAASRFSEAAGDTVALHFGQLLGGLSSLDLPFALYIDAGRNAAPTTVPLAELTSLKVSNDAGDRAYLSGQYELAASYYREALEFGSALTQTESFVASLDAVYAEISLRGIASGDSLLSYRITDSASGEVRQLVPSAATARIPARTAEGHVAASRPVEFYSLGGELAPKAEAVVEVNLDQVDALWDTLELPEAAQEETAGIHLVEAELVYAHGKLNALNSGLNFLGLDPDTVPVAPYRRLVDEARSVAELVERLQHWSQSMLSEQGRESLEEGNAELVRAAANLAVRVAQDQVAVARSRQKSAEIALQEAEDKKGLFKDPRIGAWIAAGAAITLAVVATVATVASAGTAAPAAAGAWVLAASAITGATATAASSTIAVAQTHQKVKNDRDTAGGAVSTASEEVDAALAMEALATLQFNQADEIVALLQGQDLTAAAYGRLGALADSLARALMTRAHSLAWLAERAMERETLTYGTGIQLQYQERGQSISRFFSASALLADLHLLDAQRYLAPTPARHQLKTTFSMYAIDPSALVHIRETGRCLIRIDPTHFDLRFPGTYLRLIEQVEVRFDGLVDNGAPRGILRLGVGGRARVPNRAPYVRRADLVRHDPFYPEGEYGLEDGTLPQAPYVTASLVATGGHLVLSDYKKSSDGVSMASTDETLNAAAHHGVDIYWILELPKVSNASLESIRDIEITLHVSASFDPALKAKQEDIWSNSSIEQSLLTRASLADLDGLAALQSVEHRGRGYVGLVRIQLDEGNLPPHFTDGKLTNLALHFIGFGSGVNLRVSHSFAPFGVLATTDETGGIFSSVGDEDVFGDLGDGQELIHSSRAGSPSLNAMMTSIDSAVGSGTGTTVIKFLVGDNPALVATNDDSTPRTTAVTALQFNAPDRWLRTSDTWAHHEVEVFLTDYESGITTLTLFAGTPDEASMVIESTDEGEILTVAVGGSPVPVPAHPFAKGFLLTMRCVGSTVTAFIDGQLMGTIPLGTASPSGPVQLTAYGELWDLEVQPLDSTGRLAGDRVAIDSLASTLVTHSADVILVARDVQMIELPTLEDILVVSALEATLQIS